MDLVTKAMPLHLLDLDAHEGTVKAFPAVFGNWDLDGEMVPAGAFAKTINERMRRIPMGMNHETALGITTLLQEVGRSDLPQRIQKAHPDATGGLYAEGQVVQMGPGLEWLEAEKRRQAAGRPSGSSFVARIIKATQEARGRVLAELALTEWGPTPALVHRNPAAGVFAVKAATPEELAELAQEIDLPEMLEVAGRMAAIKAGKVLSASNLQALDAAISELQRIRAAAIGTDDGGDTGAMPDAPTQKATAPALLRIADAHLSLSRLRAQLSGVTA